jgi:catechol 2,3-dioxygenase-like lactoylglutathione lyase family enzyme
MMSTIVGIVETAAYVDDLPCAERFYRDVLGLELITHEEGRHVFFRVGDRDVLLLFNAVTTIKGDVLPAHGARGAGHFALGIPSEALDDWRARLGQHGVAVEHEQTWPRGGRSLYFRDPAGNLVELVTPGIWGMPTGW